MELIGYGVRIAVAPGTRLVRLVDDPDRAAPTADSGTAVESFRSTGADGHGAQAVTVNPTGAATLDQVPGARGDGGLTLVSGQVPTVPGWWVLQGGLAGVWPPGTSILAPGEDAGWRDVHVRRDLDDGLLVAQGPVPTAQAPTPDTIPQPGQQLVDMGADDTQLWLELAFQAPDPDGRSRPWRQLVRYAPIDSQRLMVVTAQAPQGRTTATWAAAGVLAASFARNAAPRPA